MKTSQVLIIVLVVALGTVIICMHIKDLQQSDQANNRINRKIWQLGFDTIRTTLVEVIDNSTTTKIDAADLTFEQISSNRSSNFETIKLKERNT